MANSIKGAAKTAKFVAENTKNAAVDMLSHDESIGRGLVLAIQTMELTSDVLKSAMQEFLNGNAEKKGRMTVRELSKKKRR